MKHTSTNDLVQGAKHYPSVDELPVHTTIANPFQFFDVNNDPNRDGIVSNIEEWTARKTEIRDLVQHYWLGYRWETKPEDVCGKEGEEYVDNTYTFGGTSWFGMCFGGRSFNVGTEFIKLRNDLAKEIGCSVEEAEELAIKKWNDGYQVAFEKDPTNPWSKEGVARFVDNTGPISKETIPQEKRLRKFKYIEIQNRDRKDEAGVPITARFEYEIHMPTKEQREEAWGTAKTSVPFVINLGGSSFAFSAENLNRQGYALITFQPTEVYPDDLGGSGKINRDGTYTRLYPYDANTYEYASGALMAWSWAPSQIITALERPSEASPNKSLGEVYGLDSTRTVITGHSRYGKAAMFAAAFDERISICVPSEPGGSGIQSYVYSVEGKIFSFNAYEKADRVYGKTELPTVSYGQGNSWFPETAAQFVGKDDRIPFDADEIIALIAPRPFFVVSGIDSHWLGNEGGVASVQAASEVYDYIGSNEIEKNNIAIRCRESQHVFYPRDFCFALAIMDREFKQKTKGDTTLHVLDLFPEGEGISQMSYPARDYQQVSDFNYHPFEINSAYLPWSSPNKYVLWTSQNAFVTNHDVTIEAHSDAPCVQLYLPDGITKIDACKHDGEVFTFHLSKEQSVYGRYQLTTVGDEKINRRVSFSAISLSDALRHGTTKGDEGEENRVLGFASKLANTRENPPLVYVGESKVPEPMSFNGVRTVPETTSLMGYGIWFHDHLFARIAAEGWDRTKTFHVKNLKFVTMPGFLFELSFGDIVASSEDQGKKDANLFTKGISWKVEKYNNGQAKTYPAIPDTLEERKTLEAGGRVVRPATPEKVKSNYKAFITNTEYIVTNEMRTIIITFSEPLIKSELGIGMDCATGWDTSWNLEGNQLLITIKDLDITKNQGTLILFRLMDLNQNLIPGPMEEPIHFTGLGKRESSLD